MNEYCEICESRLTENIKSGRMELCCDNCHNTREVSAEETLRMEVDINKNEVFTETPQEIVDDHVNLRVRIDCSCGCKIGVLKTSGPELLVTKVCTKCLKQIKE